MQLGTEVGLGPGHIVLDGDPAPSLKGTQPVCSIFGPYICCGQMAGWIKMLLGREVGLGQSDIVLDGVPAPPPKKGHSHPLFSLCPGHIVLDGDSVVFGIYHRPSSDILEYDTFAI